LQTAGFPFRPENPTSADTLPSLTIKKFSWGNLPYFMDNVFVVAGFNRSGLYSGPQFRNLSYTGGVNAGIEAYTPVGPKSF
jgi:hypothetical protein